MPSIPLVNLKEQYQNIRQEILDAIDALLKQGNVIGGEAVTQFEQKFAQFCEAPYAVGVSSGTDALLLCLIALGIGHGDEIIMPAQSFIATCEVVRIMGGKPVFVDIEEGTHNINPKEVENKITNRTKLILPVHLYGRPANLTSLQEIAKKKNVYLISDAAQAHGAFYSNQPISQYGQAAIYSFYPGKNLGAYGDAGAVVTMDYEFSKCIQKLKDHGRATKYIHEQIGLNARLDALQAAVLTVKLQYLTSWYNKRKFIASIYKDMLKNVDIIQLPEIEFESNTHALHLFVIRVPSNIRDKMFIFLREQGIGVGIHYPIPLHLQPCNSDLGYKKGDFPIAEKIADEILSLPLYPELKKENVYYICEVIKKFIKNVKQELCNDLKATCEL